MPVAVKFVPGGVHSAPANFVLQENNVKLRVCIVVCLLGGLLPVALGQASVEVRIEKVAEGIYAAMPPHAQRFDESNAAIIVGDAGVLVVDTQTAPSVARAVIAEIRKLTSKPVHWVVNTHWHGDHVQGNSAYRDAFPGVQFLAHAHTREDVENRAIPQLKQDIEETAAWLERAGKALESGEYNGQKLTAEQIEQVRGRVERRTAQLGKLRAVTDFVLPDRTLTDSLTLRPGREIRLLHFSGHTRGDVVVYLPAERVLITGDLLDDLPYTGHGSPKALAETIRALEKLDFDAIIPGHGRVRRGAEVREHLRKVAELFDSIVKQAEAAARAGLSVDDAKKKVDVSALRPHFVTDDASTRYWNFFVGEAVARAHAEATARN
jgi:glyoxylase-like metal-dependent hydrolase (beta-lactamase superfamily II)